MVLIKTEQGIWRFVKVGLLPVDDRRMKLSTSGNFDKLNIIFVDIKQIGSKRTTLPRKYGNGKVVKTSKIWPYFIININQLKTGYHATLLFYNRPN